jgi:hypothetical protein
VQLSQGLHQFARDGVSLLGRIANAAGITTIIWAMGYSFDFSLVKLPTFDADGFPVQQRGVTNYAGLYFRDAVAAQAEDGVAARRGRGRRAHFHAHRRAVTTSPMC